MSDSQDGVENTASAATRRWSESLGAPTWLLWARLLAGFGGLCAVLAAGLAAWAPAALLRRPFWVGLLGFARLQAAEPDVLHRPELRAGLIQIALAGALLGVSALWLSRVQSSPSDSAPPTSRALQSPLAAALLTYVALWFHVASPQVLAPVTSPLLIEQHFDSHSYVHQAVAWLQGRLHIDRPLHDTIEVDGRRYTIFPPFPTLVLLPWVAAFGTSTKTLLLTPLLGAVTAYASSFGLLQLKVPPAAVAWCTAGLIFGTPFLLVSGNATDSYFANCCALACGMCAFAEATGRCRGWLVGLLLGGAVLSRQLSILMVPFFMAAVATPHALSSAEAPWSRPRSSATLARVLTLLLPLGLCVGAYGFLNWARSGDGLDTGYSSLVERGWYNHRARTFGDFHWAYVPSNLLRLFILGIGLEFEPGSYMVPKFTGFGSSLTFTSPFLYFALKNLRPHASAWPGSRHLRALAWLCSCAVVAAVLMHKSALGGYQIHGQRYTLDFTPLLFPMATVAIGKSWNHSQGLLARWLLAYSIIAAVFMLHVMPPLIALFRDLPH